MAPSPGFKLPLIECCGKLFLFVLPVQVVLEGRLAVGVVARH
jgi:hypothetical protein